MCYSSVPVIAVLVFGVVGVTSLLDVLLLGEGSGPVEGVGSLGAADKDVVVGIVQTAVGNVESVNQLPNA